MTKPKKALYSEKFYIGQEQASRESARQVVPIILDLIKPETVIDVGCGVGT